MTTLAEEEVRCKNRLLKAIEEKQDIEDKLVAKEAEAKKKGVAPEHFADVLELRSQLGDLTSLVSALGTQWREAKVNLDAERRLAKEQSREAERQKEREQQHTKEKDKDDLEL